LGEQQNQRIFHPLFVVLTFLAFSLLYALSVPVWEAPDEPAHYLRIRQLAEPGFSPPAYPGPLKTVWSERYLYSPYQDAQPPIYYLAAAAALKAVRRYTSPPDPAILFPPVRTDFREGTSLFLHLPLGLRARIAGAASVYCLRFFSVLLGALSVFLIYRIGRAVYPGEPAVALGAGGVAALLPQFNFISGAIGNDPAAALLGAGTLLYLVSRAEKVRPAGALYYLGLGVLLALGMLTKFNLVFLLPTTVIFIIMKHLESGKDQVPPLALPPPPQGRGLQETAPPGAHPPRRKAGQEAKRGIGWRRAGVALVLTATPLVVIGLATMLFFPGEVSLRSRILFFRLFRTTPELLTGSQIRYMVWTIYRSFFALFGWMSVPVSGRLYLAWGLILAAAAAGWIRKPAGGSAWLKAARRRPVGLLAASAIILLLGVLKNNLLVPQSQGRFLFPALGAISLLLAAGICRLFPDRLRIRAAWSLIGVLTVLNLIAFSQLIGQIP
jgi:hypothetical protein